MAATRHAGGHREEAEVIPLNPDQILTNIEKRNRAWRTSMEGARGEA